MNDTGSQPADSTPKLILQGQSPTEPEILAARDKPGPMAPPGEVSRGLPEWTDPLVNFLRQQISDEALVMDLCLEKAIEMVEWNYQKGLVGIEHFGEGSGGGAGPTRPIICGIAGPIALRLYEEVLKGINGPKKGGFEEAVAEAFALRDKAIIIPEDFYETPEGT